MVTITMVINVTKSECPMRLESVSVELFKRELVGIRFVER